MSKDRNDFNLVVRNSLYSFLDNFSHYLESRYLFANDQIFVVQNENVANWLKINLADKHGIAMKLNFKLPDQAIREILSYFLEIDSLLYLDEIRILLEVKIKQLGEAHPLSLFIKKSTMSTKARDKRIFELAKEVSQLFQHYNQSAIDLPLAWIKDELLVEGKKKHLKEIEEWQRELWKSIFIDDGFKSLFQIAQEIKEKIPICSLPQITILGSAFLSAMEIRLFHYFSKFTQVTQCMFSPLILSDTNSLSKVAKDWGKLLIDNRQFLLDESKAFDHEKYFSGEKNDILTMIKNSFIGKNEDKYHPVKEVDFNSFKVIGCFGRRREIEILKNQIFDLLKEDSNLKLHEIGVMAIDINDYRIFIESIFSKTVDHPHIPHNITDLSYDTNNALLDSYERIINLSESSFHLDEVERLLENTRIQNKLNVSTEEAKQFINLAKKLNILWGMNDGHRRKLKKGGGKHNTWHQGLNRIILGHYYQKDMVEEKIFFDQNEDEGTENDYFLKAYSLFENELEKTSLVIFSFLNDLYLETKNLANLKKTMRDWVELSKKLIEEYLTISNPSMADRIHEKRLLETFAQLVEISKKVSPHIPISFESFKLNWREQVKKKSVHRGNYLTEGIVFASLKPMRAIPFKHIFLLGLNEKNFPREDYSSNLNLSAHTPIKKGLHYDKTQMDKFCFLETLACAEESLHVFYCHRELQNHNPLHPSGMVLQLTEMLADKLKRTVEGVWENIHEEHPLHSFDSKYFTGSKIRNHSWRDYETAEIFLAKSISSNTIKQQPLSIEIEDVEVKDLLLLFDDPTYLFLKRGLNGHFFQPPKKLHEQEKTEVPYYKWIEYLSNLPDRHLDFEHYLNQLHQNDFISFNHFDKWSREDKKEKTHHCLEAFREIGILGKKKSYQLMPHFNKEDHPHLLPSPSFCLNNQDIFITGELSFCYQGNLLFAYSREKKANGFSYLRHYLESLLLSVSRGENSMTQTTIYEFIVFNPEWEKKTASIRMEFSPSEANKILQDWIELYHQHLKIPIPLYLSPIWDRLEYIEKLPRSEIDSLITKHLFNFNQRTNQKEYLYRQLFDYFEPNPIDWMKVKKIFKPFLDLSKSISN